MFSLICQAFFQKVFLDKISNGEGGIWTLAPLLTTYSLSRRAPSATWVLLQVLTSWIHDERRGWDSNPRALADKRFSRPPRYDHFDTSPCFCLKRWVVPNLFLLYIEESTNALPSWNLPFVQKFVFLSSAKVIIAKKPLSVNTFFQKFQIIFSKV